MKLNQKKSLTQVQTSEQPWVDCPDAWSKQFVDVIDYQAKLKRPNPPTPEAVAKAQFIDKTYVWENTTTKTKPS